MRDASQEKGNRNKKYMLFAGDHYYPIGGWNDFVDSFDSIEDAIERGARRDWYHIVDSNNFQTVKYGGK